ncbi:predicted protein [Lichtheimia corymbifera JMRC:FSU:9682]|uniref:Uncharacterized protein n=1 Tax=Lichtheimia corymbifera JMRC:FSU:9682 TaxID=1263082 RepID=A0A068S7Q8_9FUNG|nr:predicted protein [Lichtheimia corymbifera JMRC:FSU:9682]
MRRRRRQRQLQREYDQQYAAAQQACSESMIERAYNRHEQHIRLCMNDASSSATSSMLQLPPYFPPDSTLRLPEHAVARLSQAMLMAHMGRHYIPPQPQQFYTQSSTASSSSIVTPPPKYSSVVITRPPPSYCSTPTTRTSSRSSMY